MLAEEGKLDLADPPHKYLRELKPLPVTIDQMMRNSSGLPDFLELLRLGGHGLDKPARPDDLLAACLRNGHLNFEPNSRFLYSNSNFLLLGLIIEKLARKKLGDFLAERIFQPLGMTSTMLVHEIDAVIPGLATGYLGDAKNGFRRAAHAYPQGGEGGLTSTVEDLLIWSRHFDQPTLSPRDSARAACGPGAARRQPRQQISPRRAGRRAARPCHHRPWRPVAGLPHGIPAPAGSGSHRGGDRQSRQHRSLAAGPHDRHARPRRRQAAEARSAGDHRGRDQASRRHLVQRRGALPVRAGVAQRRGDRDAERPALRAGPPRRRLAGGRTRLVRVRAEAWTDGQREGRPGRRARAHFQEARPPEGRAGRPRRHLRLGRIRAPPGRSGATARTGRRASADR